MSANYEKLRDDFKKIIKKDKLSHAYLFYGGDENNCQEKFIFSQSLANFLENGIFKEPSRPLKETLIISPDEKTTIGIDRIRDLKHFLWQKPVNSSRKTAIIKGAENMTPEAQNAALKIVEEPPESTLIIFIADVEDNLFPALSSRLQKIHFSGAAGSSASRIKMADLSGEVEKITENEQAEQFLRSLIFELKKDPAKNLKKLKATLKCSVLMKQFNLNKRLQLRALISLLE